MDFTLREVFSKLFYCCCNIKVIQNKEMIFKTTKREIDNRFDILNDAKFPQEVKNIKMVL